MDMAFVIEGQDKESLPENVLCSIQLNNKSYAGNARFVEQYN